MNLSNIFVKNIQDYLNSFNDSVKKTIQILKSSYSLVIL